MQLPGDNSSLVDIKLMKHKHNAIDGSMTEFSFDPRHKKRKQPSHHTTSSLKNNEVQVLKASISELTEQANLEQTLKHQAIQAIMNAPTKFDQIIAAHNPTEMLQVAEMKLKNCFYSLDRVVRKGTEHFVKLLITTQDEYNTRIESFKASLASQRPPSSSSSKKKRPQAPRKNLLEIFDLHPINAMLDCAG